MNSDTCFEEMFEQSLIESDCSNPAKYSGFNHHNIEILIYVLNKNDTSHLIPCGCTGKDGTPKNTYDTKDEAYISADNIYDEQGIDLRVYRCNSGVGWHLTKSH